MKKYTSLSVVLLSTLVFTFLFYKQALGLNLLLFELIVLSFLFFSNAFELKKWNVISLFSSVIITAGFSVLNHSTLSFVANFISFFLFIGSVTSPNIRSLINIVPVSFLNVFLSIGTFFQKTERPEKKKSRFWYTVWKFRIYIFPFLIVILFSMIYSWANPEFGKIINSFWTFIGEQIAFIFESIDITIILVLLIGFVISTFIFVRVINKVIERKDAESSDDITRIRGDVKHSFKMISLKNEYRSGVFLFIALNLLLFGLNIMDINHVWFNFEWEGQYLKQFVHQGTYVLLGAIIISIFLVLYYFRENLNFYSKNKLLKQLTYLWIAQNVILAISVGIRNWYYIQHYALAYKRIAIVFFLLLTIFGLFSVYLKVKSQKSIYYLARTNFHAWLIVFVISAGFNWDRIIARYNFEHANKSFVHLNFLAELSDSALPYLSKSIDEVEGMESRQIKTFFFDLGSSTSMRNYKETYMSPRSYVNKMYIRKLRFKRKWENKGILEWNYAEYKAYHEMFDEK